MKEFYVVELTKKDLTKEYLINPETGNFEFKTLDKIKGHYVQDEQNIIKTQIIKKTIQEEIVEEIPNMSFEYKILKEINDIYYKLNNDYENISVSDIYNLDILDEEYFAEDLGIIERILLGIDINIAFNKDFTRCNKGKYISIIKDFCDNKICIKGFVLKSLENTFFKDLPKSIQQRFLKSPIIADIYNDYAFDNHIVERV